MIHKIEQAKELLSYMPARPDYETWIKVISAIGNEFDDLTALQILHSRFQDELPDEHRKKLRNKLEDVSYGSLVYLAKQNGYKGNYQTQRQHTRPKTSKPMQSYRQQVKELVTFSNEPNLIYRFPDYEIEERAAILEYDGNMNRQSAERQVMKEYPNAEKERLYRVSINNSVINKNCNPIDMQPYDNYEVLTSSFNNDLCTANQLIENIRKGYAICFCHLAGNKRRVSKNFQYAEMFAVDIDDGLTIEQAMNIPETEKALLIYTTPSHTEKHNRFRIIFELPRLIDNAEHYKMIVQHFINIYQGDQAAKDPARAFYGNNKATVYNIQTGEVLQ